MTRGIVRHVITKANSSVDGSESHAYGSTAILVQGHIIVHPSTWVDLNGRPRAKQEGEAQQGGANDADWIGLLPGNQRKVTC